MNLRSMRLLPFLAAALFAVGVHPASAAPKPNVIVILMDDVGWSDLGCYGGDALTPNIDALAATGLKFRQYYVTPRCSPTRCALLTGLYTQQVADDPGASLPSLVNTNNLTMAELLQANGYRTYMAGKWNLGTGALLPENRGFQQVFRYINGSDHSENPWDQSRYTFISQNNEIPTRNYTTSGQTFYQADAIGDYSVDFINHDNTVGGGAPFFLYMAFGAAHFPLGAPKALIDSYIPTFTPGWDVVRQQRYDRQLANGVIDSRYPFPPLSFTGLAPIEALPTWASLPADRQADLIRRMALYTAMIQKIDENVGKVITKLKATGQYDNTLIFLMSDNGANLEGGKFGDSDAAALTGTALANMGVDAGDTSDSLQLGAGWAHVSNTPLRLYKHFAHEGGQRSPLVVHWPAGFAAQNTWTEAVGDVIDIMPTVVAATGVTYPTTFNGHAVLPVEGTSLLPVLNGGALPDRPLFVEHESNRMMREGNWKFVTKNFAFPDGSSPANELELYDMSVDPGESHNIASANSLRTMQMVDDWNAWALRVGVPSARFLTPPPANVTPAGTPNDLFVDDFNRPDNVDTDAVTTGMSGSLISSFSAGNSWFEGWEGSGLPTSINITTDFLEMALGQGMAENGLNHNFIEPAITAAGGFSISLKILAINTDPTDTANRYVGFGVGMNATQAAKGNDFGGKSPQPFRGSTTNKGAADCFVELDMNANVKVWVHGAIVATVPVGATTGQLSAAFATTGFSTSDTVTVSVYFNGARLNLNSAAGGTVSFKWDEANANYLGLSARASNYAEMDNFAVRLLPLASALSVEYAISKGLDGADTAPTANPDNDQLSNYLEWAFGSDPGVSDDYLSNATLMISNPTNGFLFAHRRRVDYQQVGITYTYSISTDLKTWQTTVPTQIATQPLTNSPGYEAVELKLPDAAVANHPSLFVRVNAVEP